MCAIRFELLKDLLKKTAIEVLGEKRAEPFIEKLDDKGLLFRFEEDGGLQPKDLYHIEFFHELERQFDEFGVPDLIGLLEEDEFDEVASKSAGALLAFIQRANATLAAA